MPTFPLPRPSGLAWYAYAARHGVLAPLAYRAAVTRRPRALLERGDVWVDRHRVEHRVEDISPTYARAIIRFLERQAPLLLAGACSECILEESGRGPRRPESPALRRLRRLEPLEWLHEQPLLRELSARAGA